MTPPPSDPAADDRNVRLAAYRAKRHPSRTPEPFGGRVVSGGSVFVVQKHAARQLHWDLRLELDGVLLSWAVPKGPSPSQADKRLAVRTEDHPLEYAEFEGTIPEGEYGAGPMIVWDRGVWVPRGDPREGLEKGKLLFELRGFKLHGLWTLVKTKQDARSWLFIKERDAWERPDQGTGDYPDDSVYSGLRVEQLPVAEALAEAWAGRVEAAGARRGSVVVSDVRPMLATAADRPFSRNGWVFELKYDGYRMLAGRHGGEAHLRSRAGSDLTPAFPEIARAVRGLPYEGLVLDGEIVVPGPDGKPSFGRLQRRGRTAREVDALRAAAETPATFYAFDLIALEGFDLRPLPLLERKTFLRGLLPTVGPVRFLDHVDGAGEAFYEAIEKMGLEGMVAKDGASAYRGGRSRSWVKVRTERVEDFVVVGWTDPDGSREGFGALHLAEPGPAGPAGLRYAGSVGSGFSQDDLREVARELAAQATDRCPCTDGDPPAGRQHHWVRPTLVVDVRFKEWTEQRLLRHPVFVRLRPDKAPEVEPHGFGADGHPAGPVSDYGAPRVEPPGGENDRASSALARPTLSLTNPGKLFWPEDGLTKGDLLDYHRSVAAWMLPYLRDRPLVMTRYPDGIHGKSFFQKDAPHAPDWMRTVTIPSGDGERAPAYFVVDDLDALLYVVNLGTIPIHVWGARVGSLDRPDWCLLDLDPKDAPFTDVVALAREARALCEEIGVPAYPKTSGSTGMHVLIPLARRLDHEQCRTLAELLARVLVMRRPDIATLVRTPGRRAGKVYIDHVQNGYGRLMAAPFTVRPLPGAPVSTPLTWEEVDDDLRIGHHTLRTVPDRMRALGDDPMSPVLWVEPDLMGALARLGELFE